MTPRTAVVTVGGTGIGRAIALDLVARGSDVVITGRRIDVLARVPGVVFDGFPHLPGGGPRHRTGGAGRRLRGPGTMSA
jgi:NAD(P)-dependent dehydrogenase (short-subunit alcohol dehydrogenase family)